MNKLSTAKRVAVVSALVEGCSIRSTVRMTGVSKNTISKLLLQLGAACTRYQDETLRNLPCKRLQADETWSFVGGKDKNISTEQKAQGLGSIWTWTAIDADTKLIASWLVGSRDAESAYEFVQDVASRLRGRVQLTTDGHKPYLEAVEAAFGSDIDYAVLQKIYGTDSNPEKRYSPAVCLGCKVETVTGDPNPKHISTSYVERQNLTMRMSMRRFTRLTNAFSKKVENHAAAIALYFMYYNFGRVHQTLRVTPAMEAGVASHVWSIAEIVALLD
ncbi:MAG TPA: DDE-type integrase/transposase/recombinase [Vicinamibacterales bacterium]|nr:DDE-type integrase/transposase/recombinase [Vicinamibacterales bacterium]